MSGSTECEAKTRAALSGSAPAKRRPILVISSNQWTAQLVRTLLTGQGLRDVVLAMSAEKAAEALKSPIDLVIADCGPASIDGLSLVEQLRHHPEPRIAKTPALLLYPETIAVKSGSDPKFAGRCRSADIRAIVGKPIVPAKLLEQISRALPQEVGEAGVLEREIKTADNPLSQHRILIVSANKFMSQLLRTMLFGGGATGMVISEDIETAQQRVSVASYDLIVADSGPASLDGLGFTEWFRSIGPLKTKSSCPVVLLTAKPSADFVDRARRARVTAIVAKPITGRVFLNRVIKAVTNADDMEAARLAERAEARAVTARPPSPAEPKPAASQAVAANYADDDDIIIA